MSENVLAFNISMRTDIGTREEQQDYVNVITQNGKILAVVCDGMGGLDAGCVASNIAGKTLEEEFLKLKSEDNVPDFLLRSVDIMDENVSGIKSMTTESVRAGTTIVATILDGALLYWLSVGDSRLYIMRDNEFVQATRDHNFYLAVKSADNNYIPTDEELAKGEALISFIGMGGIELMDISNNPFILRKNDRLLLTTDGLFKTLTDEQIKTIIESNNDLNTASDILMDSARSSAKERDNTSFILIYVD